VTDNDLATLLRPLMPHILATVEARLRAQVFSADANGLDHKGKGPGGGQFIKGSGSGHDSLPDEKAISTAEKRPLGKGASGDLTSGSASTLDRVTIGGREYVIKSAAKSGPVGEKKAAERVRAEELSSHVAAAAGVSVPPARTVQIGGKPHVVSAWVDGTPLASVKNPKAAIDSLPEGEAGRMVLFDYATGYSDNHLGNYLVGADGRLHGIDRETSFGVDGDSPEEMAFHLDESKFLRAAAGTTDKAVRSYPLPRSAAIQVADATEKAIAHLSGTAAATAKHRVAILRKLATKESPTVGDLMALSEGRSTFADFTSTFSADSDEIRPSFSADDVARLSDYFHADDSGRYIPSLHRKFGLGQKAFADAADMRQVYAVGADGKGVMYWAKREQPKADTFADWNEDEHPRDKGEFAKKNGDGVGKAENPHPKSQAGFRAVREYLTEHGSADTAELVEHLKDSGIPATKAQSLIDDLHDRGLLDVEPGGDALRLHGHHAQEPEAGAAVKDYLEEHETASPTELVEHLKDTGLSAGAAKRLVRDLHYSGAIHRADGQFKLPPAGDSKAFAAEPGHKPAGPGGGQFVKGGGASGSTNTEPKRDPAAPVPPAAPHDPKAVAESIATELAGDNPTLRAKVADVALTAAAHAYKLALEFTHSKYARHLETLMGAVFDTPDDLKKLGYNPANSSGVANPNVHDAVRDATGISGHLAAKIAATVLTKALFYLKDKLKGTPAQMADDGDWRDGVADLLCDLYDAVHEACGLPPVEWDDVRAALEKVAEPKTFAAWNEADHPRDGGKFAKKPGAGTKAEEKDEEDDDEEPPVWDGEIDQDEVKRQRGSAEHVAEWNYVDDGQNYEQNTYVEVGEYDPFPDHPGSQPVEVYRWYSQDETGYRSDEGEWVQDESEARRRPTPRSAKS
jgi:hypothetical protein